MVISSFENEKIKNLIKLKDKKYRKKMGMFIIEGEHLTEEAYKNGIIKELILEENYETNIDAQKTYITKELMNKISEMESPSSIIALCEIKDLNEIKGNKILLLDNIQDPGNLGTIIRSAVAFNIDTIILSKDTVDLYNSKVIRSTQGMMFYVNIISMDLNEAINKIKNSNIKVYGTNVNGGTDCRTFTKYDKEKYALVMGNEGNGVKEEILEICDDYLYINMNKKVESLNVGVATSILLYELNK